MRRSTRKLSLDGASRPTLGLALTLMLGGLAAAEPATKSFAHPQTTRAAAAQKPILALSDARKQPGPDGPALAGADSSAADAVGPPQTAPASAAQDSPVASPLASPALASPAPESAAPEAASDRPALAPLNAAIKAALEARGEKDRAEGVSASRRREQDAVAAFYAARDFTPVWSRDGAPTLEAKPALQRLQLAHEDALSVTLPGRLVFSGRDEDVAASDIALSAAVVAYARQATGSRVDPASISRLIGLRPELADPSLALTLVSSAGANAGTTLRAFNPPHAGYVALRGKLIGARRAGAPLARASRSPAIPAGPTLKIGMRDPRVPLIRARLSLDGRSDDAEDLLYDMRVASAVADFQKARGLPGSGQFTARTLAVLSGGDQSRVEAEIIANMERWRWMPRDLGASRIEVNIPDYEVVVVENGAVVARHRVVVGKPETPTPIFSNAMKYLIVNPVWTVPQSIIRKEMMPKIAANSGYLKRMGYQAEWRDGKLSIRQPPGERNALGRIKFMFPNDYAVYLHDTPSRALFSEDKRAFSHGCVRVDEPLRFGEMVLGSGWSEARIEKMFGGKERYVNLPKALPIHLEYFTASVDSYGQLQLREDLYGYSRKVRAALGLEGKR